jgi:superfamily II DNA or RNA helicase
VRAPVAARLAESASGRTIVFHERVHEANRILRLIKARNLSATIYHTGVGPVLRRSNLSLYRRGVYDILVCCRALDEGINVPETSFAIVASSTASMRQRIQRLGRVLRPAPGKKRAVIYTLYATNTEEKRLRSESEALAEAATTRWMRATTDA